MYFWHGFLLADYRISQTKSFVKMYSTGQYSSLQKITVSCPIDLFRKRNYYCEHSYCNKRELTCIVCLLHHHRRNKGTYVHRYVRA